MNSNLTHSMLLCRTQILNDKLHSNLYIDSKLYALLAMTSTLPLQLQVAEKCKTYEVKRLGQNPPSKLDMRNDYSKVAEQLRAVRMWPLDKDTYPAFVNMGIQRTFDTVNYRMTQFLTGHGCFGYYLLRFKRLDAPECHDYLRQQTMLNTHSLSVTAGRDNVENLR